MEFRPLIEFPDLSTPFGPSRDYQITGRTQHPACLRPSLPQSFGNRFRRRIFRKDWGLGANPPKLGLIRFPLQPAKTEWNFPGWMARMTGRNSVTCVPWVVFQVAAVMDSLAERRVS